MIERSTVTKSHKCLKVWRIYRIKGFVRVEKKQQTSETYKQTSPNKNCNSWFLKDAYKSNYFEQFRIHLLHKKATFFFITLWLERYFHLYENTTLPTGFLS